MRSNRCSAVSNFALKGSTSRLTGPRWDLADVQAKAFQCGVYTVLPLSVTDQIYLYNVQPFSAHGERFHFHVMPFPDSRKPAERHRLILATPPLAA
jgi:hypothetical protein